MQIDISPSTQQLLSKMIQSGEFKDYDAAIAFLASKSVKTPELPKLPDSLNIAEVIREQGVQPIGDFRSLKGDFYPPGETSEEFLQAIGERRQFDAPTAE